MGGEGETPAAVTAAEVRPQGDGADGARLRAMSQAQFLSWKCRKDAVATERKAEAARKREEDIAAGAVQMNGRELFLREPWVFDNSRF